MKRLGYSILVALVMQLTGIAGLCAPPQTPAEHDCCTPSEQDRPVAPQRTVPECCLVTVFHEQVSTGQTKPASESASQEMLVVERAPAQPPVYRLSAIYRQNVSHPVSPPISPLRQTCLLLI
jgi:hypothetical protein